MININSKYFTLLKLLRNEYLSPDELISRQNTALVKLVNHSYKTVKFYKKLFDKYGLHPGDIKSIDDISKLPIIDKKIMAQNPINDLISNRYNKHSLISIKTAGSNGKPFEFFIDSKYDQFRKAQFIRPYIINGQKPWDRSLIFSVHKATSKKWFQKAGLMSEIKVNPGTDLDDQIKTLHNFRPDIIRGYGSVLNLLAIKIINDNVKIQKPKLLSTDSELLIPEMRRNIETAFSTDIIDIYGTFETDNIAFECREHNGYHMTTDCVIIEFIKDGKPVGPLEDGEIVVTVLNNFSMPFIRYNMHDIGCYDSRLCSCGRTFPLLKKIKGRANDYMITRDGVKLSFFNIARFDKLAPHIKEYQIIQENFDSFTVLIVPNKTYCNEGEDIIVPAIKKIFSHAVININFVDEIKRESSGKFMAFKSKVKL